MGGRGCRALGDVWQCNAGKRPAMSETVTQAAAKKAQKSSVVAFTSGGRPETLSQPLADLREGMDRMFDNFSCDFGSASGRLPRRVGEEAQPLWRFDTGFGMTAPAIDVVEVGKEYRVVAEQPGVEACEVELSVSDDMLIITGEKKEQREERTENYFLAERRFGSSLRFFRLPSGVARDRFGVEFDKGVLTVTLPKTAEAAARQRKIDVNQAS